MIGGITVRGALTYLLRLYVYDLAAYGRKARLYLLKARLYLLLLASLVAATGGAWFLLHNFGGW